MKQALLITFLFVLDGVYGHLYRDRWMNGNGIDPDYMHHRAMAAWSRNAVLEEKIRNDDISSLRAIDVTAAAEPLTIDFAGILAILLPNSQRFMYGFVNGTRSLGDASICSANLNNAIDKMFALVEVRFVWLPQYSIKFQQTQTDFQNYINTAYAYCDLTQLYSVIASLMDT